MDWEWLKLLPAPLAILGAATLAWLTRRAERLKDSYADWAAAVFGLVSIQNELEPNASFGGTHTPNPEWVEWNRASRSSLAALRAARAVLHTREPSTKLRERVDELSVFRNGTNLEARVKDVQGLLAEISKESWLVLSMRHIDSTEGAN